MSWTQQSFALDIHQTPSPHISPWRFVDVHGSPITFTTKTQKPAFLASKILYTGASWLGQSLPSGLSLINQAIALPSMQEDPAGQSRGTLMKRIIRAGVWGIWAQPTVRLSLHVHGPWTGCAHNSPSTTPFCHVPKYRRTSPHHESYPDSPCWNLLELHKGLM